MHVGRPVERGDSHGLERLARYVRRLHIAESRIVYEEENDRVIYSSGKKPHPKFKANFRIFEAQDFVAELAGFIPDPYRHESRAYGEYSNVVRGKRRLRALPEDELTYLAPRPALVKHRWRDLLKRIFEVDPLRCTCGGEMRIVSFVTQPWLIEQILRCLGRWPPPRRLPRRARPPPEEPPPPPRAKLDPEFSQVPLWWDDDATFSQVPPDENE